MLQKKPKKLYILLLFKPIISLQINSLKPTKTPTLTSLEFSNKPLLGNTSHFFKKLTFIGLGLANVLFNKYRTLKIRSVISSLWNMIATYIFTF